MATQANIFQENLTALRKTHGRSMKWVIDKYGKLDRPAFYTLLSEDRFTASEKDELRYLIINGRNKK